VKEEDTPISPQLNEWLEAARSEQEWKVPEGFFEQQYSLLSDSLEWQVPPAFFEEQKAAITASIRKSKNKTIRLWIISAAAVAASVVGVLLLVLKKDEPSFAELWVAQPLNEEMVVDALSEDELLEWALADTLITDSIWVNAPPDSPSPDSLKVLPLSPDSLRLKPITWDSLSTEELMNYLLESDNDDWMN
jgi:hypothetical protein